MLQRVKMGRVLAAFVVAFGLLGGEIFACTRVLYEGANKNVLTGRSMDFSMDIPANMWVFPRAMERSSGAGEFSFTWTSRYGSVVTSSWNIATSDGMNEKGLMANLLWLVKSEYPEIGEMKNKKGLSVSMWAQYVLDNFATVKEAVAALRKEEFVVLSDYIPGTKKFTTVHLSISDALGDSAIFEYIGGKLIIHHNSAYTVVTNDPAFEEQLAIESYFRELDGTKFLPGANGSSDRFVRAGFYLSALPQTDNAALGVATLMSLLRNVSVPYGITTHDKPHISSTRWRVVSDHKNLLYYFENVLTPNLIWVDLKKLDFSKNAGVKRLLLQNNESYVGEVNAAFEEAEAFEFKSAR